MASFSSRPTAIVQLMPREILDDDPTYDATCIERLRAVSPADVQRVPQQSLRLSDTVILVSGPA